MLDARPKSILSPQTGVVKGKLEVDSENGLVVELGLNEVVEDCVVGS